MRLQKHVILLGVILAIPAFWGAYSATINPDGAALLLPSAERWSGGSRVNADGAGMHAVGLYYEGGAIRNAADACLFLTPLVFHAFNPEEGEGDLPHPGDLNTDWRITISEAIAYLAGWQQGGNPIGYAIRAAYLWQNGEQYIYDPNSTPPLCWILLP